MIGPRRIVRVHTSSPPPLSSLAPPSIAPLQALDDMPLNNRRILVTAPLQYASKLCSKIVAKGGRPLWVPAVQITAITDPQRLHDLDACLKDLQRYSHLLFTSKNGISAVVHRLEYLHGGLGPAVRALQRSGVRVWALGADAEALRAVGIGAETPPEASTQGLCRHLASLGQLEGATPLCPVPQVSGGLVEPDVVPRFIEALRAGGAQPTRVASYLTTLGSTPEACGPERDLLASGAVSAVVFSSTAEAQGFAALMGGREAVRGLLTSHGVVLAAHGPYTARGVSETLELPVTVVGKDYSSFDGVVSALEEFFSIRSRDRGAGS